MSELGKSLCFRCEHRAQWHETGGKHQPRMECGEVNSSKYACYMYIPVQPVRIKRLDIDDPRPLSPGYRFASPFSES